jgi:molybdopterin molybdotransferase
MISIAEARSFVIGSCRPLPADHLPPEKALGLVLAEPVQANEAVPPFDNSAMDGYALRAADTQEGAARLRVVGTLMAGNDPDGVVVGRGEAVRIMTGAPLPAGADAVCMIERTHPDGDGFVGIEGRHSPGTNIRRSGDDIPAGSQVFPAGTRLTPAHIGVLASIGASAVSVHRRPRVGIASTGDELVASPGPLPPGKIRDSNRATLLAQVRSDGWEAVDLGWAGDDPERLAEVLLGAALDCDALMTSGGVSVGDRDIVRLVLEKLGGDHARTMQVAVKPGKPFAFSTLPPKGTPAFGLPGNPVSALVSYELFARPALRFMAGHGELDRPRLRAIAGADLPRPRDGKLYLVRVIASLDASGELRVRPQAGQGSHQLRAMAGANALAVLPDGEGRRAGEPVEVLLLDPDALASPHK